MISDPIGRSFCQSSLFKPTLWSPKCPCLWPALSPGPSQEELQRELAARQHPPCCAVRAPRNRKYTAWRGGSLLAGSEGYEMEGALIWREDWEEEGARLFAHDA